MHLSWRKVWLSKVNRNPRSSKSKIILSPPIELALVLRYFLRLILLVLQPANEHENDYKGSVLIGSISYSSGGI